MMRVARGSRVRRVVMLEVEHPDSERRVHADLVAYGVARAAALEQRSVREGGGGFRGYAVEEASVLLAGGVPAHARGSPGDDHKGAPPAAATGTGGACSGCSMTPPTRSTARRARMVSVRRRVRRSTRPLRRSQEARPRRSWRCWIGCSSWAEVMAVREDARTKRLLDWVQEHVKPDSEYTEERVIVFSEYRATQRYLQERLTARGIGGDRVELLDGTIREDERERIKSQWQEPPEDFPVRVLLATDAASEGISLQRHCHLLAHAEIPWNPNRLGAAQRTDRPSRPARGGGARASLRQRRLGERFARVAGGRSRLPRARGE